MAPEMRQFSAEGLRKSELGGVDKVPPGMGGSGRRDEKRIFLGALGNRARLPGIRKIGSGPPEEKIRGKSEGLAAVGRAGDTAGFIYIQKSLITASLWAGSTRVIISRNNTKAMARMNKWFVINSCRTSIKFLGIRPPAPDRISHPLYAS
jgi:hypothetical protein